MSENLKQGKPSTQAQEVIRFLDPPQPASSMPSAQISTTPANPVAKLNSPQVRENQTECGRPNPHAKVASLPTMVNSLSIIGSSSTSVPANQFVASPRSEPVQRMPPAGTYAERNTDLDRPTAGTVVTPTNAKAGLKVCRGPSWKWGEQDGGKGCIGKLKGKPSTRGWHRVKWGSGYTDSYYRIGAEGQFDLQYVDQNTPIIAPRFRVGMVVCLSWMYKKCGDAKDGPLYPGITGVVVADDESDKPYKVRAPNGKEWWYPTKALTTPGSSNAAHTLPGHVVTESNAKAGFRVCRGPDWNWGDQDGGKGRMGVMKEPGKVKGWWKVEWDNGNTDDYRVGGDKKFDLVFFIALQDDPESDEG